MKNGSNAHYGYPITSLRELPFDKSGSQFVNELPKRQEPETALSTICYALGIIEKPGKNNLNSACDPIKLGLLYEISKKKVDESNWIKIYPEVESLYRNIIMAQDELCAGDAIAQGKPCKKSRQKATRGKLERRTFYKLSVELASKLRQSEPLDYVDYVYLNTPQVYCRLLRNFQEHLTNNFETITDEIKNMPADQAVDILCTALPLAYEIRRAIQDRKEAREMDPSKGAEPAPNSNDLNELRSELLSKRKELYLDAKTFENKAVHQIDPRVHIFDKSSPENNERLQDYFNIEGAVKNQKEYNDSALPYYKAWLLHQLDPNAIKKGNNTREIYRFYWNFLNKKSEDEVRKHVAQKLQTRIDELFDDLSSGQFIRYYYTPTHYNSAVDIFLDGMLRNAYDHLFAAVHKAFSTMMCVRRSWSAFHTSLEQMHILQTDTTIDTDIREKIQLLTKSPAFALSNMLETANWQLRKDYSQLELCDILDTDCRNVYLQKNQEIIQWLDKTPLEVKPKELTFLSEEYDALLYNCHVILQYEKEKSISDIVDSFLKSCSP